MVAQEDKFVKMAYAFNNKNTFEAMSMVSITKILHSSLPGNNWVVTLTNKEKQIKLIKILKLWLNGKIKTSKKISR